MLQSLRFGAVKFGIWLLVFRSNIMPNNEDGGEMRLLSYSPDYTVS